MSARRHAHSDRGLVARPVVGVDDAAGGDPAQRRRRNQRRFTGGKLPALEPSDHHGEFDLAIVLAGCAGGPYAGDDGLRLGAVPDQVELVAGDEPLADQHLGELGDEIVHSRQALTGLVGCGLGDAAVGEQEGGRGADDDKAPEPEQQHVRHATRLCRPTGYRTQLYSVQMSTGTEPAKALAVTQPRRAVIDRAWRAIGPGVEVLSSDDGGPLRRTIKRIIDPLVLRLRSNTRYSAPFVAADVAEAMHGVIVGHGPVLRAAAAWFEILKRERRRLRITTGNAQELYFPVCFELAVTKGPPAEQDRDAAEAVLRDIHTDRDRTAIEVLNGHVSDRQVIAKLADQLDHSWRDVRAGKEITGPFMAGLTTVLGPADSHASAAARQRVWHALIADAAPYNLGAKAHSQRTDSPWSIVELGLSSVEPQQPPAIVGGSDGDRPLNRAVVDRVRGTLRRVLDRDELPDIPMLCAEEVDRACAPWGLLAEDKQATLIAGIEIAVDLAPLAEAAGTRYELAGQVQARLRKEAYVLHARRYLADGGPVHPRQQQVIDDLAAFARPYLSRLWARLHGRDVWQEPCDDVDEVRALLEGVARSVSLDHRQRIKSMLELQVAG